MNDDYGLLDWLDEDATSAMKADERMAQAFPPISAFYTKYALDPKEQPSCLVCGKQLPAKITHMELPGIIVCFACAEAPQALSRLKAAGYEGGLK